jgi:hypothetical protein
MAVSTKLNFKGIEIPSAYCSLQNYSIKKQYHDKVKNYVVFCELFIFSSDSKEYLLETDTINFLINDQVELTTEKIWQEIKKKYPGVDILD